MSTQTLAAKKIVNFNLKLSFIFKDQPLLAWEMMQQECNIYTRPQLDAEEVNKLSSYYRKIVEKLNTMQDPREKYFTNKMQKLMAEPFIIRTYSNFAEKKQSNELDQKRKQIQLKLSIENQKQNSQSFQYILNAQTQKQKKLKSKISQILTEHEKKLQNRLHIRHMKSITSPKKKNSPQQNLQIKVQQTKNPQIYKLNFSGSKNNNKAAFDYIAKTQSERQVFYLDLSDQSSEDQYKIQQLVLEEKNKRLITKE